MSNSAPTAPKTPGAQAAGAARLVALARRPPPRRPLARLIERLEPGSGVLKVTRLKGGVSSRTFEVRYAATGGVRAAVLRIYVPGSHDADHHRIENEWLTLQALEAAPFPAPRPVHLDLAGDLFGAPSMVVSRLPGGPLPYPRDRKTFLRRLADALAAIHAFGREALAAGRLQHLPRRAEDYLRQRLRSGISPELAAASSGPDVWRALEQLVDSVRLLPPVLTHMDFWPGNTVWSRGRLTGVVDWITAEIADPRFDVAQCRTDLALMYGLDWAEEFASHYERAAGAVGDLAFWDLYTARGALTSVPYFVEGYRDLGLREHTTAVHEQRLAAFIADALARSSRP